MTRIANIYTALLMLYYLQGTLYSSGSSLSRAFLIMILFVSLYFFIRANTKYSLPRPMRILTILVLVFSLYGIFPIIFGVGNVARSVEPSQFLKTIYLSLLPCYAYYCFFKEGRMTEEQIRKWFVVFLLVALASYYYNRANLIAYFAEEGNYVEDITNNEGYTILSLICLLPLFSRKPFLQFGFLAICLLYVLMGFKRGAILAGALSTVWMLYHTIKQPGDSKQKGRKLLVLFFSIVVILGSVYVFKYLVSNNLYFNTRMENTIEGNSSHRDEYFSFLINYFFNGQDALHFLFGNGCYGTLIVFINGAHNDWLEIAIDHGLVFLLVYFAYWISLISMLIKGNKRSTPTIMLGVFIIVYFMKTLYSMSYNTVTPYASIAYAYAMVYYEYATIKKYD